MFKLEIFGFDEINSPLIVIQEKEYGEIPPVTSIVILPSSNPKQETGSILVAVILTTEGSVNTKSFNSNTQSF